MKKKRVQISQGIVSPGNVSEALQNPPAGFVRRSRPERLNDLPSVDALYRPCTSTSQVRFENPSLFASPESAAFLRVLCRSRQGAGSHLARRVAQRRIACCSLCCCVASTRYSCPGAYLRLLISSRCVHENASRSPPPFLTESPNRHGVGILLKNGRDCPRHWLMICSNKECTVRCWARLQTAHSAHLSFSKAQKLSIIGDLPQEQNVDCIPCIARFIASSTVRCLSYFRKLRFSVYPRKPFLPIKTDRGF